MSDADMTAMREMGEWLSEGERELTIYRATHFTIELGDYPIARSWTAIMPTIAEAWSAVRAQEGFPCD